MMYFLGSITLDDVVEKRNLALAAIDQAGQGPLCEADEAMRTYLDHNATSPLRPAAREAMLAAMEHARQCLVRPSRRPPGAQALLDDARDAVARALGVIAPMVVIHLRRQRSQQPGASRVRPFERLLVSAIEHPSVIEAAKAAGKPVEIIPVMPQGVVDLAALAKLLDRAQERWSA